VGSTESKSPKEAGFLRDAAASANCELKTEMSETLCILTVVWWHGRAMLHSWERSEIPTKF